VTPGTAWLARKEWREVVTSRAFLIFAVLVGPLVGHAFIVAVGTYAEVSGVGGGAAALSQGVSPLDGILVPTFGAYAIAASLLFPFVAIRSVSDEKESGALDLMLQSHTALAKQALVKLGVLLAVWVLAWIPGLVALALWKAKGGHLDGGEVLSVLSGHLARGALVISVAMLAAAVADSAAAAAVLALAFTLGAWALEFVAQVQGGGAQRLADLGPEGMLHAFERGEVRLAVIGVMLAAVAMNAALGVVWLHPGRRRRDCWLATIAIAAAGALFMTGAARLRASRDVSEDRRNSFSVADERALRAIAAPVRIEVNLAPEDPRLADLDREVLRKLRRTVRDIAIVTSARSSTGLFGERSEYGEVWYQVGSRRAMSRSTTEPIVLEVIYGLAGVQPPARSTQPAYPGYPLAARVALEPWIFYLLFPLGAVALWVACRRL
jgi:hypothetical protein